MKKYVNGEYIEITPEEIAEMEQMISHKSRAELISDSKAALAAYLAAHPLTWVDGKTYNVTEDKQALLMGNIAAYQIEVQSNPAAVVTWNASGEECAVWDIGQLCALAVAIKNYVKPLVAAQQAYEVAVMSADTDADANAVKLAYGEETYK